MKIGSWNTRWAEFFHADDRTDRQTDRHDEANSLLSQFCEGALKSRYYFGGLFLQILLTKTAGVLSYIYIRIPQTTVHFSMTFLPQPTRSYGEVFFLHLRLHIQALSDAWTQFTSVTRQGTNCWQLVTNHSTDWQLVTNHSTDWQLFTNYQSMLLKSELVSLYTMKACKGSTGLQPHSLLTWVHRSVPGQKRSSHNSIKIKKHNYHHHHLEIGS